MDSTPSQAPLRAPVELAPGVLSLDVWTSVPAMSSPSTSRCALLTSRATLLARGTPSAPWCQPWRNESFAQSAASAAFTCAGLHPRCSSDRRTLRRLPLPLGSALAPSGAGCSCTVHSGLARSSGQPAWSTWRPPRPLSRLRSLTARPTCLNPQARSIPLAGSSAAARRPVRLAPGSSSRRA